MSAGIHFLTVEDVVALHAMAMQDQRGDPTIRDRGLLESAVAMPQQQVSGHYLHDDIIAMAAAYGFHICSNHPFVDGNKRAALAAIVAFLSDNGMRFVADADAGERQILSLAAGSLSKLQFTDWIRQNVR